MDDKQLSRKLQTIGMGFFIKYFELINDPSVNGDMLATRVVEAEKYNQAWTKIRIDYSRDIIREGHRNDALRKISQARLNKEITSKASRLLNDITASPSPRSSAPLPPRPPVSTQMVVADSMLIDAAVLDYVRKATASELLALYATTLDELRERDIVRSANAPGGDYAELLFVRAFGWTRVNNSVAGYDAVDAGKLRYQVKSRRLHHPTTSRQLSALRNFSDAPFDFLAGVLFNKDFSVMRAAIIPYNVIQPRFSNHTNSSIFFLEDRVWNLLAC